jgi:hypothetical protein
MPGSGPVPSWSRLRSATLGWNSEEALRKDGLRGWLYTDTPKCVLWLISENRYMLFENCQCLRSRW